MAVFSAWSSCLPEQRIIAAAMGGETEVTPGTLNRRFTEADVYDKEGNLQWEKLEELGSFQVEVYGDVNTEILENCLESQRYPVVRVRMHGWGSFHYVLIVAAKDGQFLCMDPLQDELMELSCYGNRVYAIRCVWPGTY